MDPSKISIHTRHVSVAELALTIQEKIRLDSPPRWTRIQQGQLIDSLLARIPISPIYLDASQGSPSCLGLDPGTPWMIPLKGAQRLLTIRYFFQEEGELEGMEFFPLLNGKKLSQIPPFLQRRLKESPIEVHLIQPGAPIELVWNLQRRLETR